MVVSYPSFKTQHFHETFSFESYFQILLSVFHRFSLCIRKFLHLVDNNLFTYHYQPIVDVRTGDVVGYEALMRTDKSIGMRPVEVLSYAARLKRLYDVEKLTMRNTL